MIDWSNAATGSPEWWLKRLLRKLEERSFEQLRWERYYNGKQSLAFASDKFREAFGSRFPAFSSNFCALVVDAERERLEVSGFRFRDQEGDADLWAIWQDNDLDAASQIAHTEALVKGVAYTLVEPGGDGATPRITVEDPLDVITEADVRNRRRQQAGLKRWVDEEDRLVVYVYLPDAIYKYRSAAPWTSPTGVMADSDPWPRGVRFDAWQPPGEDDWPMPNSMGTVPLVPLPNRPRLKRYGQSEIAPIMSNQDAVNKYRADALVAAEYAAFRQRWVIGLEVETDPDTGRSISPFQAAVDRLWVVPPPDPEDPAPPKVEFGEFEVSDLTPYKLMIETEVGHVSSISRTPYHYLLGQPQAVPPSGESLKASEAGLSAKVHTAQIHFGEGWEDTMRLALRASRDERADIRNAETLWADRETRNEATRTDAVIKQYQAGLVDRATALGELGYSPEQVARIASAQAVPASPDLEELARRAELWGVLIRGGATPASAAQVAGLEGLEHTGLEPITVAEQGDFTTRPAVPTEA